MKIPIADIVITERQRRDLGNIDDLARSLQTLGLIQPITVRQLDGKYVLLDGRRRLEAATQLGWTDIAVYVRGCETETQHQMIELEADIRRKDRTWQERCLAVAKIHYLKTIERAADSEAWTTAMLAEFSGCGVTSARYMLELANEIKRDPDGPVANARTYFDATGMLGKKQLDPVEQELERRRQEKIAAGGVEALLPQGKDQVLDPNAAEQPPPTLGMRASYWNNAYPHLPPLVVHVDDDGSQFLYGHWFLGGGRHSDFYGSYHTEYLARISTLFPDLKQVVHLFSGSLPAGPYVRVGIDPTGQYKPDIQGDAEQLSSFLPFHPDLIYADPPYSEEDAQHYKISLVNRPKVVEECGAVLKPGGFLVWLDQALPVFSNDLMRWVGCISYVRSTGNRFRCVCIFQKPYDQQANP